MTAPAIKINETLTVKNIKRKQELYSDGWINFEHNNFGILTCWLMPRWVYQRVYNIIVNALPTIKSLSLLNYSSAFHSSHT